MEHINWTMVLNKKEFPSNVVWIFLHEVKLLVQLQVWTCKICKKTRKMDTEPTSGESLDLVTVLLLWLPEDRHTIPCEILGSCHSFCTTPLVARTPPPVLPWHFYISNFLSTVGQQRWTMEQEDLEEMKRIRGRVFVSLWAKVRSHYIIRSMSCVNPCTLVSINWIWLIGVEKIVNSNRSAGAFFLWSSTVCVLSTVLS